MRRDGNCSIRIEFFFEVLHFLLSGGEERDRREMFLFDKARTNSRSDHDKKRIEFIKPRRTRLLSINSSLRLATCLIF